MIYSGICGGGCEADCRDCRRYQRLMEYDCDDYDRDDDYAPQKIKKESEE